MAKPNNSDPVGPIPSFDDDLFDRIQSEDDPLTMETVLDSMLDGVTHHIKNKFEIRGKVQQLPIWGHFASVDLSQLVALDDGVDYVPFQKPNANAASSTTVPVGSVDHDLNSDERDTRVDFQVDHSVQSTAAGVELTGMPNSREDAIRVSQRNLNPETQDVLKDSDLEPVASDDGRSMPPPSAVPKSESEDVPVDQADPDEISDRYKARQKSIQDLMDDTKGSVQ